LLAKELMEGAKLKSKPAAHITIRPIVESTAAEGVDASIVPNVRAVAPMST
jgi:hypothetical protein